MNLRLNTLAGWCTVAVLAGLVGCGTTSTTPGTTAPIDAAGDSATGDAGDIQSSSDAVDATGDAYDNAACCAKAKATCGMVTGVNGCKQSCGACASGSTCDKTLHKCVVQDVKKKFGEACGPSKDCPAPTTQAEVDTYVSCLDDQCDTGRCDFGDTYFSNSGVCGKECQIGADLKNNASGASSPDGVEDGLEDSECTDAVDGPAGTNYRCAQTGPVGQGSSKAFCRAGTTFKSCTRDGDCAATEACGLLPIGGKYGSVCVTRWKSGNGATGKKFSEACNSGFSPGDVATCANNFCLGGACLGFCKTDDDCLTAPGACTGGKCAGSGATCSSDKDCSALSCVADQKILSNVDQTYSYCKAKKCSSNKDCGADFYCGPSYNDVTSGGGDPDPSDKTKVIFPGIEGRCRHKAKGAKLGELCDQYPGNQSADSAGSCEAAGMCIAGGCSTLCKTDADCATGQKCGTFQDLINVGDTKNPDFVSPQFKACIGLPSATASCAVDSQCGKDQACRWWSFSVDLPLGGTSTSLPGEPTPTESVLTGGGICVVPGAKDLPNGAMCGSDSPNDAVCATGACVNRALTWTNTNTGNPLNIGACLPLCTSQADCAAGVDFVTSGDGKTKTHYNTFCSSDLSIYTSNDPYDPTGRVYRPVCKPFSPTEKPIDCSATKKCADARQACFPIGIANGPDKPAKVDFFCLNTVGAKDPAPTKKVGDACDANPDSTKLEECASGMCYPDVAANAGYCAGLCSSDADCGNGTVCDMNHQAIARKDVSKAAIVPTCVKKKAGIPCDFDSACHSDFRCTHTAPATTIGNPPGSCAAQCSVDADCASQGGGKCEAAKDRFSKPVPGVKVCSPK